jgi:hypothetical protein
LAGIVGNVPSPDTAMSGLAVPLALLSFGAVLGLASIYLSADVYGVVGSARQTMQTNRAALLEIVDEGLALLEGVTPTKAEKLPDRPSPYRIGAANSASGSRVWGRAALVPQS